MKVRKPRPEVAPHADRLGLVRAFLSVKRAQTQREAELRGMLSTTAPPVREFGAGEADQRPSSSPPQNVPDVVAHLRRLGVL